MGHSEESGESAGEFLRIAALKSAPRLGRFFSRFWGLFQFPKSLHGLRRRLQSFAASRLELAALSSLQCLLTRPFGPEKHLVLNGPGGQFFQARDRQVGIGIGGFDGADAGAC